MLIKCPLFPCIPLGFPQAISIMFTRQDILTSIASVEMVREDKTEFILTAQSAQKPIWSRR
jgi:hypothetical protein